MYQEGGAGLRVTNKDRSQSRLSQQWIKVVGCPAAKLRAPPDAPGPWATWAQS